MANDNPVRLFDGSHQPTPEEVTALIGPDALRRWEHLMGFITENYPDVFPADDWIYGGKKHGWGLRFKKSKSFCILAPEQDRFLAVIVLGGAERAAVEPILGEFDPTIRELYESAFTYHDGKWLAVPVEEDTILGDIERLLAIKRKPKRR